MAFSLMESNMNEKIKANIQPMTLKDALEFADAIEYNSVIYDQILFMDNEIEFFS